MGANCPHWPGLTRGKRGLMALTQGDKNVVYNLRNDPKVKDRLAKHSDEAIAEAWQDFSLSDEYPDMDKFPDWIKED